MPRRQRQAVGPRTSTSLRLARACPCDHRKTVELRNSSGAAGELCFPHLTPSLSRPPHASPLVVDAAYARRHPVRHYHLKICHSSQRFHCHRRRSNLALELALDLALALALFLFVFDLGIVSALTLTIVLALALGLALVPTVRALSL